MLSGAVARGGGVRCLRKMFSLLGNSAASTAVAEIIIIIIIIIIIA